MADWLDTADKLASVIGAAAGVAALVITVRANSRRAAPPPEPSAPTGRPVPDTASGHYGQPGPPTGSTPVTPTPFPEQLAPPAGPTPRPAPGGRARSSARSDVADVLTVLVYCVGSALLGAWILSSLGGGSIGPWWLLVAMTVSYGIGLFFGFGDLDSPGVVLLYVLWLPTAAWLATRAVVYYWFPDLFDNRGTGSVVVFVVVLLIGVVGGLVKAFNPR